jgi:CrcB protein
MNWLLVALGGALGSRSGASTFPWAILAVNVVGCALAGALVGALSARPQADSQSLRAFAGVGVLGGFTTFSAFGADTFVLAQSGRPVLAALNVVANVALSLAAVAAGYAAARAALT